MNSAYDVIVVGAGCGGAAAGALAAYYGHATLILEKNGIIGGRAATYEKDGLKMDHGHVLLRCRKGPHGKLLKMVKCSDLIPRFSYAYDWGIKSICDDKISDLPPHRLRIFLPFRALREYWNFRFTIREMIQFNLFAAAAILMPQWLIRKYDRMDANTFLARFSTNRYFHTILGGIVTVTMGASLDQASAGELMRVIKSGCLDLIAIGYPVNGEGIAAIPKSFIRAAQRYGADVALNAPVERIVVENNRVRGVVTAGRMIEAAVVISNAGIHETVFKLVGEEKFDRAYARKIKDLKYSYGGLSLKYVLDQPITQYAWGGEIPGNLDRVARDMSSGKVPERLPWMYVATTNIDPLLAKDGKQLISVISGGASSEPGQTDWQAWMDKVRQQVEEYFPNLKDHVIQCYAESPDDIARFTGRRYGDAVGVAQTVDQVGDLRPSPVSPIKGLFYAGADVGRNNIATELATQSAIALAPYLRKGKFHAQQV